MKLGFWLTVDKCFVLFLQLLVSTHNYIVNDAADVLPAMYSSVLTGSTQWITGGIDDDGHLNGSFR